MFPLTRPVRQTLATFFLIVLTVAPTALVATFAWRINRPGHIRDVEIELGRSLAFRSPSKGSGIPSLGKWCIKGSS